MKTNLKSLIARLNGTTRKAMEAAANVALSRTHYEVDVEHVLLELLANPESDCAAILKAFGQEIPALEKDLRGGLDRLRTGNTRTPVLSVNIPKWLESAWLLASIDHGFIQLRSGFLLAALVTDQDLRRALGSSLDCLSRIPAEELRENLGKILQMSKEPVDISAYADRGASLGQLSGGAGVSASGAAGGSGPVANPATPALNRFTVDLTAQARAGKLDPVLGRDMEVRQMIDILLRRRQNNPILTGEPGVGKTAVVEGLAAQIVKGEVPDPLKNITLLVLDLGLLQAGASVKGEFENRLRSVIDEVKASISPIILFIDEAHTMIGAGGQAGQSDAANLLKPALARGELRTIAATTWAEYKKYFEKDAALARRFQVVKIEEPSEEDAVQMMRGVAVAMEAHHKVRILDEAVVESVRLSSRYLSGRQLPDKSVSVLDTACARVALSRASVPAPIEALLRQIENTDREAAALRKEAEDLNHLPRLEALRRRRLELEQALDEQKAAFSAQTALVQRIQSLRTALVAPPSTGAGAGASAGAGSGRKDAPFQSISSPKAATLDARPGYLLTASADAAPLAALTPVAAAENGLAVHGIDEHPAEAHALETDTSHAMDTALQELEEKRFELGEALKQLRAMHKREPLIYECVDGATVAEVISGWTGIPLGRMVADELDSVRHLQTILEARILGQSHALERIARSLQIARSGLEDPGKPKGVFLLLGPSGVGKTETALALADALYGGERNMVSINMSEYQEAHTVSGLKGSPPGYVGYGEGGVLTEAVRRRPYSVVLLDEVEKAHPDVLELFYQVFDKGRLEDAEGREVDFKNTIIILTSNVGSDLIMRAVEHGVTVDGESRKPTPEDLIELVRSACLKVFKPAFLGRLCLVPYYPVQDEVLKNIVKLKLDRICRRVEENHGAPMTYDDGLVTLLADRCLDVESGARNADSILSSLILGELSNQVLATLAEGRKIGEIQLSLNENAIQIKVISTDVND